MKLLNVAKGNAALMGVLAGTISLPVSSFCSANCSACYGCFTAGGTILLITVLGNKMKERRKT